jgi:nucleoside-diphosphate-sugar epimerase
MRVLVIGGTRFIGRAIVDRLLRDGHEVTLIDRGHSADPFGTRVRRVVGDRRSPEILHSGLRKRDHDAVVDVTGYQPADLRPCLEVFPERIGHYIFVSSAAVYMIRSDLAPPYSEDHFAGALVPVSQRPQSLWQYAQEKRRSEELLFAAWDSARFPVTALRPPMVVGAHDSTRRLDAYLERLLSRGPLILPDGGLNSWGFLWVEDLAEAVVTNLASVVTFGEAYNLAQREATTVRELVTQAARALDLPAQIVPLPATWLEATGLGTWFSPYSHSEDVLLDCHRAAKDLLFRSTPMWTWIEELAQDARSRWTGAVTAFAATRAYELDLVREVASIRLPSYTIGGSRLVSS